MNEMFKVQGLAVPADNNKLMLQIYDAALQEINKAPDKVRTAYIVYFVSELTGKCKAIRAIAPIDVV